MKKTKMKQNKNQKKKKQRLSRKECGQTIQFILLFKIFSIKNNFSFFCIDFGCVIVSSLLFPSISTVFYPSLSLYLSILIVDWGLSD